MSDNNLAWAGPIRQVAKHAGREPTDDQVETVAMEIRSLGIIDPATGVVTVNFDNRTIGVGDYMAERAKSFPKIKATSTADTSTPAEWITITHASGTMTRRADDPMAQVMNGFQQREAAKTAREVASWPNPWRSGSENRTRQAVIKNTNPALAEKLMKEAGL